MKTFRETITKAAQEVDSQEIVDKLFDKLTDDECQFLEWAADYYSKKSNSHKHSVMQAEGSDGAQGAAVGQRSGGQNVSVECNHHFDKNGGIFRCIKCGEMHKLD